MNILRRLIEFIPKTVSTFFHRGDNIKHCNLKRKDRRLKPLQRNSFYA